MAHSKRGDAQQPNAIKIVGALGLSPASANPGLGSGFGPGIYWDSSTAGVAVVIDPTGSVVAITSGGGGGGSGTISGSGVANYIPRFSSATIVASSILSDDGTNLSATAAGTINLVASGTTVTISGKTSAIALSTAAGTASDVAVILKSSASGWNSAAKLLSIRDGGTEKFSFTQGGTFTGTNATHSGTLTAAAIALGGDLTATAGVDHNLIISNPAATGSGGSWTITAADANSVGTGGNISLGGGLGKGGGDAGSISLQAGNAATGGINGGITIEGGAGAGTAPTLTLGATYGHAINIGNATSTVTIAGTCNVSTCFKIGSVRIDPTSPTNGYALIYSSAASSFTSQAVAAAPSGTTSRLATYASTTTFGTSIMSDDGTTVTMIGVSGGTFDINGLASSSAATLKDSNALTLTGHYATGSTAYAYKFVCSPTSTTPTANLKLYAGANHLWSFTSSGRIQGGADATAARVYSTDATGLMTVDSGVASLQGQSKYCQFDSTGITFSGGNLFSGADSNYDFGKTNVRWYDGYFSDALFMYGSAASGGAPLQNSGKIDFKGWYFSSSSVNTARSMQLQHIVSNIAPVSRLSIQLNASEVAFIADSGQWGVATANVQTTVGAASGASALPATPSGYFKIYYNGTTYVTPFYAAS